MRRSILALRWVERSRCAPAGPPLPDGLRWGPLRGWKPDPGPRPIPMSQRIVVVDAFADRPFVGNPAAVCLLDEPREVPWMQDVAREMNLAETAFLVEEPGGYHLRWFTPTVEVDLCGHATLASAHVLWEDGHLSKPDAPPSSVRGAGRLTATKARRLDHARLPGDAGRGARSTPRRSPTPSACRSGSPGGAGSTSWPRSSPNRSSGRSSPTSAGSRSIPARGLIVTARSDAPGFDFVSRFFAPQSGVPETRHRLGALLPSAPTGSGEARPVGAWSATRRRAGAGIVRVRPRGGPGPPRRAGGDGDGRPRWSKD